MKKTILFLTIIFLLVLMSAEASMVAQAVDWDAAVPVPRPITSGLAGGTTFGELVIAVIQILLYIVGSISVLFLIIGGFRYVLAHGNEEQAEGAKKTMIHAIIGLAVVILSFAVITIITNILVAGQL